MESLPPIQSPPGTAFREFRIRFLPIITFALVLALTLFTWQQQIGPTSLTGEVEMVRSIVSSPTPGRLTQLHVDLMTRVVAGQAIAEVQPADPRAIEAEAALSRARLEIVRSGLEPKLRRDNNHISYLRLRLEWLSERVNLSTLIAQLRFNEAEYNRILALAPSATNQLGVASIFDLQVAERDLEVARRMLDEQTLLVEEMGEAVERMKLDQNSIDNELPLAIQAALDVEERVLDSLDQLLQPLPLVAAIDGYVSFIYRRAGENVIAGEPVVTISAESSERIVAYVQQPLKRIPTAGDSVQIRSRSTPRRMAMSVVLSVGGQLEPIFPELLPLRAAGNQRIEYGLPVIVRAPTEMALIPGEIVDLHIPLP